MVRHPAMSCVVCLSLWLPAERTVIGHAGHDIVVFTPVSCEFGLLLELARVHYAPCPVGFVGVNLRGSWLAGRAPANPSGLITLRIGWECIL